MLHRMYDKQEVSSRRYIKNKTKQKIEWYRLAKLLDTEKETEKDILQKWKSAREKRKEYPMPIGKHLPSISGKRKERDWERKEENPLDK